MSCLSHFESIAKHFQTDSWYSKHWASLRVKDLNFMRDVLGVMRELSEPEMNRAMFQLPNSLPNRTKIAELLCVYSNKFGSRLPK